jgi:pimeloyl-ACP methyl ester carboxylesterase
VKSDIQKIKIPFEGRTLHGRHARCENPKRTILIMHGAGSSSCQGFANLQVFLGLHSIETITFDFLGHGETGGDMSVSSLDARTEQALGVINHLNLQQNLNVMGFSMGAHNAVKIAARVSADRLGLAIPAVYSSKASTIKFGPSFTSCIRRYRSWEDSECFSHIESFKGKLLVISAEKDAVIPSEIPCRLVEKAKNCISAEHHCIRKAGHDLAAHFTRSPQSRQLTLNSILRWLA